MFYLGDCIESPVYRGGELHSRCNGTPSSGGYEIVGSVTAIEFIAGRAKRRWGSFDSVSFASCTPFARKRGTTSNIAKRSVWALDYIGLK